MAKLEPIPDKKFGTVWRWVFPDVCPDGHEAPQRPSWEGCVAGGGHHNFTCAVCKVHYPDPDCVCQRDEECE